MMKIKSFSTLFIIFAWVYHFASDGSFNSGILLVLSALYLLIEAFKEAGGDNHANR